MFSCSTYSKRVSSTYNTIFKSCSTYIRPRLHKGIQSYFFRARTILQSRVLRSRDMFIKPVCLLRVQSSELPIRTRPYKWMRSADEEVVEALARPWSEGPRSSGSKEVPLGWRLPQDFEMNAEALFNVVGVVSCLASFTLDVTTSITSSSDSIYSSPDIQPLSIELVFRSFPRT